VLPHRYGPAPIRCRSSHALHPSQTLHLNTPGEAIHFDHGPKVNRVWALARQETTLNVSHSLGLVGNVSNQEPGVDIELVRSDRSFGEHRAAILLPGEVEDRLSLPVELRARGFLNGWGRKDALMKATGEGLRLPLDSFQLVH
jgi:phosphopantetheinyl transferase